MKKYTPKERLDALNRHRETLVITKETGFTALTQHINYDMIEEFCDAIINYEKLSELYDETKSFYKNTELYKKRKEIFFNEHRELTDEETECCIKKDVEFQIFLKECYDKAQLKF